MKISYTLRPGFVVKAPVSAIGARIEALKKRHATKEKPEGWTTTDEIIDEARSRDSPLHNSITWDVNEAAQKTWHNEARYLMRCYEVRIEVPNREPIILGPGSVRITSEDRKSIFVSPDAAMSQEDSARQVLKETMDMANGLQARLMRLQGLSPDLIRAIEEIKILIAEEIKRRQQDSKSIKAERNGQSLSSGSTGKRKAAKHSPVKE
jgi:hypothetical protein